MNGLTLTPEEINKLRTIHRLAKDKKGADRIKAVYLLRIGYSVEDVVKVLMLDEETLRKYVKRYQQGGLSAFLKDNYKGSSAKLTAERLQELEVYLEHYTYLTVEAIVAHVQNTYGITYSVSGMTDLLHRLDFTYKKSKLVPAKVDKEKQQKFLDDLTAIKETKGENDPILYMDGVHPQHNTMLAYGWIKKGKDKFIKSNTGRERININGALDSESYEIIVREDERINALSTIALLKKLENAYPLAAVIYVICDNAKYYCSKLVREFLETSKVQLLFLPPYAPNLNLIEQLWKFMKKKVLYNQYYEQFEQFRDAVFGFFENVGQCKTELDSLLTTNFNLLDAAFS